MMNVRKLEHAEAWEGNAKLVKQLSTVLMTTGKKVLGGSSMTMNTMVQYCRTGNIPA